MKFGVLSDIHGNLEALQAAAAELTRRGIERWVCLGDLVGYGPDPGACIELIRRQADLVLAGNHDHAALGLTDPAWFNPQARAAILWTRSRLTPDEAAYLKDLPVSRSWQGACLAHSSPREPGQWHYILSLEEAQENFPCFPERLCFVGHSHVPAVFVEEEGEVRCEDSVRGGLETGGRYLINVGSVGQPRDGDPRAAFLIYDSAAEEFELVRIPYDIAATQAKMRRAGLPRFLIERLAVGY